MPHGQINSGSQSRNFLSFQERWALTESPTYNTNLASLPKKMNYGRHLKVISGLGICNSILHIGLLTLEKLIFFRPHSILATAICFKTF